VHLPALAFRTVSVLKNGTTQDVIQSQRFLSFEIAPNYSLTKNVAVGIFYLYGRGIEEDAPQHTHLLSLRGNFSNIKLSKNYFLRFNPQLFYLKLDNKDGYYVSSSLTLARQNFPLSISSIMYRPIQTDIVGKDFDWNVSIVYSFNRNFTKQ
jgi:hypothetical protein